MRVKCEYCKNYISETDEICPNCAAPNLKLKRNAFGAPTTIEELKKWYVDHNLPDEKITRFFIGKNNSEPKAFGIYHDEAKDTFVVYKNKSDGTRAIRYEGKDELYAVNELYLKLKEEISNQKSNNRLKSSSRYNSAPSKKKGNGCLNLFILAISFVAFVLFVSIFQREKGYYLYNDNVYYLVETCNSLIKNECEWYKYDQESSYWSESDYPKGIKNNDGFGENIKSVESKVATPINLKYGYYYFNESVYYSYNDCKLYDINLCEWYKYDQNNKSWSIVSYPIGLKEIDYVKYIWENDSYSEYKPIIDSIKIEKQYDQEEWFRIKHPKTPSNGYYKYKGNTLYYYNTNWYIYNNGWSQYYESTDDLNLNHEDYYEGYYNNEVSEQFEDSDYYNNYSTDDYDYDYDNDDWDSDSSWDSSDSWDSDSTDWDSDW